MNVFSESEVIVFIKRSLLNALILFSLFSPTACTKPATQTSMVTEENIVFGKGGDVDLKLDICRPAASADLRPAVVFIFGGGWGYYAAARNQCPINFAAYKGYVGITIDYRLISEKDSRGKVKYPFPAQIEDVKCALRWTRANAKKYDIDPNRIGVVGWASGGHLALLAGLTTSADGLDGSGGNSGYASDVRAVVCMAGMVDAASLYKAEDDSKNLVLLLGGTPGEVPNQYRFASPITYARRDSPPVLFVRGDLDELSPLEQGQMLKEKMDKAGADCSIVIKKGKGHVSFYSDPDVWNFLDRYLKKK
jgi:acetyl esterase/lipase